VIGFRKIRTVSYVTINKDKGPSILGK